MDLLNSTPVIELSGDEFLPVEGKTFIQQVSEYFQSQGGVAHSPFGDVLLDKKGIKNSKNHGINRLKSSAFAAVKDVLEKGIIILPIDYHNVHDKKQLTGMIAAPIMIANEKYICVVVVIANLQIRRLYVHEAFLTKNLQEIVATSQVPSSIDTTSPQSQGEIAKVLKNFLISKQKPTNSQETNEKGSFGDSITPRYNIIKENNQINCNKNMNRNRINVVRLTESKLREMI